MIEILICNLPKNLDENQLTKLLESMSNKYHEKVKKKQILKDRFRTTIGYSLVRYYFLNKGFQKKEIIITENIYGKPKVYNNKNIEFNISHSENKIACIFSESDIGIDIEYFNEINIDDICILLSEKEKWMLDSESLKSARLNKFYKLWTIKESFYKCKGETLDLKYTDCEIKFLKDVSVVFDKKIKKKFYIKSLVIDKSYSLSFCTTNMSNFENYKISYIEFSSLMR